MTTKTAERKPTAKERDDIIGIYQFMKRIPDEAAAVKYLEDLRWGERLECPKCGSLRATRTETGKPMSHWCPECRRHFSVRTGTIMAQSQLSLHKWLLAIHLVHTGRKGISSIQLSKELECTQKTAWFLLHRIREAMSNTMDAWLGGVVELDETWIGGERKNMHDNKKISKDDPYENKFAVWGARAADGTVVAFPIRRTDARTLQDAALTYIKGGSTVYTDGEAAYRILPKYGYDHDWVNHGTGQYVKGEATTNGIESFWALLKRGYEGVYHYMSWKHLHRYVNEFSFRHNRRPSNGFGIIDAVFGQMEGKRLTYQQLKTPKVATALVW